MLYTIAIVLTILWLIGFNVLGQYIHILLIIAIVVVLVRVIRGQNPFAG